MPAIRVLIVENEGIVALDLKNRLEQLGYAVVDIASAGPDAVQAVDTLQPDLVLMDIRLRGEMDGIQAAQVIRNRHDLPIIYLTAFTDQETLERAKITEPVGYLVKPIEDRELHSVIEVALFKHGMEKKLRESEARFRRMSENARDAIFRLDVPDGHYEYISHGAVDVFGYTPQEFYDTPRLLTRIAHPDWAGWLDGQWARSLAGQVTPFFEYQIVHKSGETRWIHQRNVPVADETGRLIAMEGIATDITERKRVEQELQAEQERFLTVLDSIDAQIHVIDMDSKAVLYANQAMERAFGGPLVGKICYQVFQNRSEPCPHCNVGELLDAPAEQRAILAWENYNPITNRWYLNHDRAIPWVDGRLVRLEVSFDITERRNAEEALRESEERFRLISSLTSDVAYSIRVDAAGRLRPAWHSGPLEALTGYTPAHFQDPAAWLDIVHPDDRAAARQLFDERLAGRTSVMELRIRHADGSVRWLRETGRPLLDPVSGRLIGLVGAIQDVTARREADEALRENSRQLERALAELQTTQAQLVQQERVAAVGQLAAGVAHDFNNILAVIVLESQLGLLNPQTGSAQQRHLRTIREQAGRAADLIQQMLDFSRQSILEQRPLDMVPLLKEQIKLMRRTLPETIRLELELDCRPGDCTVNADLTRMQQMIMNLILNARDAMSPMGGGTLRLRLARGESDGTCSICGRPISGDWVRLSVSDTGIGIDPSIMPHIFEPFFTTRSPQGSGLGLAQVQGIVAQHDGHISVHSARGSGSTFVILLPPLAGDARPAGELADTSLPLGSGELILVVEDEPAVRDALASGLESLNYRTLAAENGEQALAIVRAQPDLRMVVSDVVMPEIGGVQLCQMIARQRPELPVLLLTGYSPEQVGIELEQVSAAAWLRKPVSLDTLATAIAEALAGAAKLAAS